MKRLLAGLWVVLLIALPALSATAEEPETRVVRIIATCDLHGKFLPWDYVLNAASPSGSMAQLATAI